MPASGSTCPAPAMLYASTSAVPALLSYRVRVHPETGVSVEEGVWLTPSTFVHSFTSSPKFG